MILALLLVVTNAQYRACVQAGACKPAAFEDPHSAATGKAENAAAYRKVSGDNQPAVGVSWNDARAYCEWAKKRLATAREVKRGKLALWVADERGAVVGKGPRRREDPWARAPWLSFRCAR